MINRLHPPLDLLQQCAPFGLFPIRKLVHPVRSSSSRLTHSLSLAIRYPSNPQVRFPLMDVDVGFGLPAAVRLPAFASDGMAICLPPLRHHSDTDATTLFFSMRTCLWRLLECDEELGRVGLSVGGSDAAADSCAP